MSFYNQPQPSQASSGSVAFDAGLRSYMLGVYNYMVSALILTGLVAWFTSQAAVTHDASGALALTDFGQAIFMSPLKWAVLLAPFGVVVYLSARFNQMSTGTAKAWFWAYAALMGLSLGSIFLVYTGTNVARAFFITASAFGGLSLYGYTTSRALSGTASFLMMGLIGVIVASLVNLFVHSSAIEFLVSVVGVLVFAGLTAYDTQKLKLTYSQFAGQADILGKSAVMGALTLYLDFINLFLMILRFTGNRR